MRFFSWWDFSHDEIFLMGRFFSWWAKSWVDNTANPAFSWDAAIKLSKWYCHWVQFLTKGFGGFLQINLKIPSLYWDPPVPLVLFVPWCKIMDLICGNLGEKNIPKIFCNKLDCGLCLIHGIMSLLNAQQSFVELGVIQLWVKHADNQEVQQKT